MFAPTAFTLLLEHSQGFRTFQSGSVSAHDSISEPMIGRSKSCRLLQLGAAILVRGATGLVRRRTCR
jgi:hypothetical protein